MTNVPNPYDLLGIPKDADQPQIRKAFRKKALQHHPDVSSDPDATSVFQQINAAYQLLSNPDKRRAYDRTLNRRSSSRPANSRASQQPQTEQQPTQDGDHQEEILKSAICPICKRRKNPGFRTCYPCRPAEEICPRCQGFKRPRYSLCFTCRFG